ncbi:hypothetical protein BU25DRAFT_478739 [Macroventuria anomochaeta]|uniref:Uncharacterized protein n=1 Tax=Macroventuria anomochaeta TaxID=301207 RepID=A0ACB6RN30_9PLEO|nr:uncharacterized protein BU25DRAFT_478739 [Macroventuria anomochaeta]KAF2623143.1 hypothetical protein BU25DRAFT_478739 [Macroventuria anomochaeta]
MRLCGGPAFFFGFTSSAQTRSSEARSLQPPMSALTTPNGSARNGTDTVVSGRVSKNPKACEECRRRKQKCDGKTPCNLCSKRNSQCTYRSYIRQRAGRASSTYQNSSVTPSKEIPSNSLPRETIAAPINNDNDEPSDGLPRSMPPRLAIFNNIRATQDTSRGRTELFYGASSPFSVLQHLDAHLPMQGARAVYPSLGAEAVQNGDRSIRSYNYQNIIFDHLPDPIPYLNGFDATSYASAKIALRNFLVTACPRLPFLDSNTLCANFEKLYSLNGGTILSTACRALVIAALGLGALPLTDLPYRQLFLAQARTEAVTIMYDINTKTVQASLMLAQFEFEAGSPNICYLHLGGAIRKAFAAGVHRSNTHESEQTMWTLYCNESLICFILGKQPGLADEDIAFPRPEDTSYMAYFVRLCAIVRSAYRIYHLDDTVMADLTAAQAVYQQLYGFSTLLKENTRLEIGGQLYALAGEDLAWHITFSYVFYVTKLLLFRPFLLLCLELKRRGVIDILKERNGGVEMTVLYETAERSVGSARDIINFSDSLFLLQIGTEGLYNHGFYLESACFILALAAVHHSSHLSSDCFEKLHIGFKLLRQLGSHEPVRSTSAAVEQMINRIRELPGRPGSGVGQTVDDGQLSTAMSSPSNPTTQPAVSLEATSALDPMQDALNTVGWDHDLSLDDLWSMMDWNVGFSSMDPISTTMAEL